MDKKYLPSNKEDLSFVKELYKIENINIIQEDIPVLLEWLQDFNWIQAQLICDYLMKFPLTIFEREILEILNGNDDMWKYWVLLRLIEPNIKASDLLLIFNIRNIAFNPTLGEWESEVSDIAQQILRKL